MIGKCKEHTDTSLVKEYPKEGNGKYVEYCPKCREESPLFQMFKSSTVIKDRFPASSPYVEMPLSCKGCTLKETVHCKSCVRNATTDWYTTD